MAQAAPPAGDPPAAAGAAGNQQQQPKKNRITVKVGMIGDQQIGKTSLMVKYVENHFGDDYIQTLGVNFMEKTVPFRNTDIVFSIWDLGGQHQYLHMLPLVCNDALALFFIFDLSRKSTLSSLKVWYRQARELNRKALPFLIGTKYDAFTTMKPEEQTEITNTARRFARAMRAPLIFSSAAHSINVLKIFRILLSLLLGYPCKVPEINRIGDPIIEYQHLLSPAQLKAQEEGGAGAKKDDEDQPQQQQQQ